MEAKGKQKVQGGFTHSGGMKLVISLYSPISENSQIVDSFTSVNFCQILQVNFEIHWIERLRLSEYATVCPKTVGAAEYATVTLQWRSLIVWVIDAIGLVSVCRMRHASRSLDTLHFL